MEPLFLKLLGGFELRRAEGGTLELSSRKSAALIAYLALQGGRPQSREKLASLLWDESPEDHARASLRQALLGIRRVLAGRHFIFEPRPDWLALDTSGITVDVTLFDQAIGAGGFAALEHAVGLYDGDLLEGIRLHSDSYETWLMSERQRLRSAVLNAIQTLLEAGQPGPAEEQIQFALRALALDPAQESAHRTLMRLYAECGRRSEALRQYYRCRDTLWREFSIRPEPATDMLYRSMLARTANSFGPPI